MASLGTGSHTFTRRTIAGAIWRDARSNGLNRRTAAAVFLYACWVMRRKTSRTIHFTFEAGEA